MAGIHATARNMTNTPWLRANPPCSPAAPGVLNRRPRGGISGHGQHPPTAGPAWTPRWALLGRAWGPEPRGPRRPGPNPSPIPWCPLLSPSLSSKAEKPQPSPVGDGLRTVLEDTSPRHRQHRESSAQPHHPFEGPAAAKGSGGTWGHPGTGRPGGVRPWLPSRPSLPLLMGELRRGGAGLLCVPREKPQPPSQHYRQQGGACPLSSIVRTVPGSCFRCVALKQRTRPVLPTPSAGRSTAESEGTNDTNRSGMVGPLCQRQTRTPGEDGPPRQREPRI